MPPAKKLTVAIGGGVIRSVRAAARRRNESVDRFVRNVLWHYCMGWIDDRSTVIAEAVRVAKGVEGGYRAQANAMTSEYDDTSGVHAQAEGAKEAADAIHRIVPTRRRR